MKLITTCLFHIIIFLVFSEIILNKPIKEITQIKKTKQRKEIKIQRFSNNLIKRKNKIKRKSHITTNQSNKFDKNYIMKLILNKSNGNINNIIKNTKELEDIPIIKDYSALSKILSHIKEYNSRESYRNINEFCFQFQADIESLLGFTNLIEEKTIIKVENINNSIMNTVTDEKLSLEDKTLIIKTKLAKVEELIISDFRNIKKKLIKYEESSKRKICRIKAQFKENIGKYLP